MCQNIGLTSVKFQSLLDHARNATSSVIQPEATTEDLLLQNTNINNLLRKGSINYGEGRHCLPIQVVLTWLS